MNNNNKLADLLYGDAENYRIFEKKYPKRNVSGEVTRFAPSPTGYLHIGHLFPSIISRRTADSTGGVFYMRIEDTDKKRKVHDACDVLFSTLKIFGIVPDEGCQSNGEEIGNYGPYTQSKRINIYRSYAKKLVEDGKAFPCFCDKADGKEGVLLRRKKELASSNTISEKDPCRNLSYEEIEKNISEGKPFALRLKSKGEEGERVCFFDEIRGKIEIEQNSKDVVLLKSDGLPSYAFAHVIDDHLMHTTLIVRGAEWLPSTPAHLEIFDALGFEKIKYLHPPFICKIDEVTGGKRKISKSKDPEADMRFFIKNGYPTEAILEYILTIANSAFEPWRRANPNVDNSEYKFDYHNLGLSSLLFDIVKLNDIAKEVISKMSAEEVFDEVLSWAKAFDFNFADILENNKMKAVAAFAIDRYTSKPRKDIFKWSMIWGYYGYIFSPPVKFEIEETEVSLCRKAATHYAKIYDSSHSKEEWFAAIKNMAGQLGYATDNKEFKENPQKFKGNVAKVCEFIRITLTGRKNSPDLYEISKVIGKDGVEAALKSFQVSFK